MDIEKVGVRKFRADLPYYVSQSEIPIAITKHGDTLGYFIPSRAPTPTTDDLTQLKTTFEALQHVLAKTGIIEDEVIAEFQIMRQSA